MTAAPKPEKPKPVSFRPSPRDAENMKRIRAEIPWITTDADTIRYALEKAARGRRA